MNDDLSVITKLIDEFIISSDEELLIPFEFTNTQRSQIHEYVRQKSDSNVISESVLLNSSRNKKIKLKKISDNHQELISDQVSREEVEFFSTYVGVPFPCAYTEYAEHYVELFDEIYETRELWDLFNRERKIFQLKKESSHAMGQITSFFSSNDEYKNLMNSPKPKISQQIKIKGDVYKMTRIGKHFVSIDIKSANFTVLKNNCPTIFMHDSKSLEWTDFVKLFTKSEFIAKSKHFREIVFGHTGFVSKACSFQEKMIDDTHKIVEAWANKTNTKMNLVVKCGDELVYELENPDDFIEKLESESESESLSSIVGSNYHIKVFKLEQIETKNFYMKNYLYNTNCGGRTNRDDVKLIHKIEFKMVPKIFFPQVVRWYKHEPIHQDDLLFTHEGCLARFETIIFN